MIELTPTEADDLEFLSLVQRIANGAIAVLLVPEVYLVHVDNWFDFKWLGWWSKWERGGMKELRVPPFNPNRVLGQKHFVWDPRASTWTSDGSGKPLHVPQPGRRTFAKAISQISNCSAFIWYSGRSAPDKAGSLMVYRSGIDDYAWYASFKKADRWQINHECRILRSQLESFAKRGGEMELAPTHRKK